MSNFVLIFMCFSLGILFRRFKTFPSNAPITLNRYVMFIALPALTLAQIQRLHVQGDFWMPVSMAWLHYALGIGFFYRLSRSHEVPPKTLGTLMLTGSLGNTSFGGFALLDALYGAIAIPVGILVDQPGTFLVAGSLGVGTAAYFAGAKASPKLVLRRVFSFPPFIALIVAFILRAVPLEQGAFNILDRLGSTMLPISLLSVGMQLHFHPEKIRENLKYLIWGLGFKLFLAPLFFVFLYAAVFHQRGEVLHYTLTEAAMAPMITAGILAAQYELDIDLANLMVGIGTPLCLLTVPLWTSIVRLI